MTRVICVASGKGGVGKTTVTSNVGLALTDFGKRVLVMDGNLTTPNLGFHLGVPLYPKTLHDVLRGDAYAEEAVFVHPSGMNIIPAGISINDLKNTRPHKLSNVVLDLVGDHDVILIDGAAGLGREAIASLKAADEVLIVTNPQLPSVTDALKTVKIAEELGTHVMGIALNRVGSQKSELTLEEVESLLGYPVISMIPDEEHVQEGLSAKTPVVAFKPNSKAAVEMKRLAAGMGGIEYEPPIQETGSGFFSRVMNVFRGL